MQLRHVAIQYLSISRAQERNIIIHWTTHVFESDKVALQRSLDFSHAIEQSVKTFPYEDTVRRKITIVLSIQGCPHFFSSYSHCLSVDDRITRGPISHP